jgi:hypothetical protein
MKILRIVVFFFLLLITGCSTPPVQPNYRCSSLDTDLNLLAQCEQSRSCLYGYEDLVALIGRMSKCAYEPEVKDAPKPRIS